ncbi:MAG: DNA repair protein RadA [Bacillota bacterium]|nr:DNA repair protein RadA [Bacillota bacterium]
MKTKTVFFCKECGNEYSKWMGKCPACGAWNSLTEQTVKESSSKSASVQKKVLAVGMKEIDTNEEPRIKTGIGELDNVLGGGLVKGSLVLVGGEPGIGKSTLLLEICQTLGNFGPVLYITGEESVKQIKLRADRLSVDTDNLKILPQTDIDEAFLEVDRLKPTACIVDSIQTMFTDEVSGTGGSVTQIRDVTLRIMRKAKETNTAFFIVGHVTKDGNLAGPRLLEHMVDCVLYFEGDRNQNYRILRAAKNRFGSTNEVGVFEMTDKGLIEVPNPSSALLSGRPKGESGSAVTCLMEGSRPILAEVQALVSPTGFGIPRRASDGMDFNRLVVLIAVIEKKLGLNMQNQDAYVNVVGGLKIDETCADIAALCSIISSLKNKSLDSETMFLGEVGLAGEIRAVSNVSRRVAEGCQLGFKKCILPEANIKAVADFDNKMQFIPVKTIRDVLNADIYTK